MVVWGMWDVCRRECTWVVRRRSCLCASVPPHRGHRSTNYPNRTCAGASSGGCMLMIHVLVLMCLCQSVCVCVCRCDRRMYTMDRSVPVHARACMLHICPCSVHQSMPVGARKACLTLRPWTCRKFLWICWRSRSSWTSIVPSKAQSGQAWLECTCGNADLAGTSTPMACRSAAQRPRTRWDQPWCTEWNHGRRKSCRSLNRHPGHIRRVAGRLHPTWGLTCRACWDFNSSDPVLHFSGSWERWTNLKLW